MGGHGEKMLGEHCRIRNHLKSILLKDGIRNMRVLDTLGSLTHKNTVAEQLTSLKSLVSKDNVHLTAQGYKALAEGIYREETGALFLISLFLMVIFPNGQSS